MPSRFPPIERYGDYDDDDDDDDDGYDARPPRRLSKPRMTNRRFSQGEDFGCVLPPPSSSSSPSFRDHQRQVGSLPLLMRRHPLRTTTNPPSSSTSTTIPFEDAVSQLSSTVHNSLRALRQLVARFRDETKGIAAYATEPMLNLLWQSKLKRKDAKEKTKKKKGGNGQDPSGGGVYDSRDGYDSDRGAAADDDVDGGPRSEGERIDRLMERLEAKLDIAFVAGVQKQPPQPQRDGPCSDEAAARRHPARVRELAVKIGQRARGLQKQFPAVLRSCIDLEDFNGELDLLIKELETNKRLWDRDAGGDGSRAKADEVDGQDQAGFDYPDDGAGGM